MVKLKMISWINKNKLETLIVVLILALTLGMRLYKISGYMTFLGDEGRDALVIQGILVNHHIPLLGPPTSVGNMYLGPLYYYMMAVPMAIFWLNPLAAAVMAAFIGTGSVFLIYFLARNWFGKEAAFLSSLLYSISPVNIIYSRSSWNPNPAPFFALLSILGLYLTRVRKNYLWFILTGTALAFACQMHYLALILLPVFGVLWIYDLVLINKKKLEVKNFGWGTFLGILSFLILMSPLVIFDFRHNFVNFHAFQALLSGKSGGIGFNVVDSLGQFLPIYNNVLINDYMAGKVATIALIVSVLVFIPIVWVIIKKIKGRAFNWPILSLGVWLLVGLLGMSFYRNSVYDHYLGFLNPAPFLLLGALIYLTARDFRKVLVIALFLVLVPLNLVSSPLKYPPNNQLQRTQDIAHFIISESGNQPFNFALLSEHNYDSAYQFYLGRFGHPPQKVPFVKTSQLFVVCEDQVCQPINNPKYEIAAFGYAKIESVQDFDGVKLFKLVPNPTGKP